jgi:hypothetical protein
MRKTYLFAFLDDHSRLVPHAQFYLSESLNSYLHALEQALLKRGLPRKLYLDNGPAFRSNHLEHITASLGIALVHSSPYKPEGRGKIERFFRTVRGQFLSGFNGNTLHDLNEAFDLWLTDIYHQRTHSSTAQSPFARFTSHMQCTITLNGKLYEAPITLIGKQVLLLYHEKEPARVEVLYNHQSYGFLTPVDLHINARVKRDKHNRTDVYPSETTSKYQGGKLWSPTTQGR